VAALGALLLGVYMRQFQLSASGGSPIALIALRKDIAAGEVLTEAMLIAHQVPESYVESRQIQAAELPRVLGVRAAIDLEANHTLAWTDLATTPREQQSLSNRVPRGMRAMSILRSGRGGFGKLLRPGDRVDVLLTRVKPGDDSRAVTVPLLQSVLVLAVGNNMRATYADATPDDDRVVTLLLTVDQASLLAHARRSGELSLTLRNEDDVEISNGLPETNDSDVLDLEKRARRQTRTFIERVD
jgi:pilus assembly protein CpaB